MIKVSDYYKNLFGQKVYKISLDAGCTCPNRDGTKGTGGCIFCSQSGSGDFIKNTTSISEQFAHGCALVNDKAKGRSGEGKVLYLPYFQAFTSTYGNIEELRSKYKEALEQENVCGLAVATRPDCIDLKIIEMLKEIIESAVCAGGKKTFIQLELGLQTSNEETGKIINRCYTNEDYIDAVKLIKSELPSAHVVTHLIFGLPGEEEKHMLESVEFVKNTNDVFNDSYWGIKITNLYVLQNTVLEAMFKNCEYVPMEQCEYFSILEKAVNRLPENCVIHRLNGDPPKKESVSPQWCLNKKAVLNELNRIFK